MSDLPPDPVLGEGWRADTIPLAADSVQDRPKATLVRRAQVGPRVLLWIHGFNDYFFHEHLAEPLAGAGWQLAGLDLRRYGRNLQPGVPRALVDDLDRHHEELAEAVARLRAAGAGSVVLAAHSTGGLVATRWLQTAGSVVEGLVLNAPFLALPPVPLEPVVRGVVRWAAKLAPTWGWSGRTASPYGRTLAHPDVVPGASGRWRFRPDWKFVDRSDVRLGWLAAVERAQQAVRAGPNLPVPTLALLSARSCRPWAGLEAATAADVVLEVDRLRAVLDTLGPSVHTLALEGAVHDVFLSAPAPLQQATEALLGFLADREDAPISKPASRS